MNEDREKVLRAFSSPQSATEFLITKYNAGINTHHAEVVKLFREKESLRDKTEMLKVKVSCLLRDVEVAEANALRASGPVSAHALLELGLKLAHYELSLKGELKKMPIAKADFNASNVITAIACSSAVNAVETPTATLLRSASGLRDPMEQARLGCSPPSFALQRLYSALSTDIHERRFITVGVATVKKMLPRHRCRHHRCHHRHRRY